MRSVPILLFCLAACGPSLRENESSVSRYAQKFAENKPVASSIDANRVQRVQALLPKLKEILDGEAKAFPSLAIGLVVGDELVWSSGWGARDDASKDPVTAQTVFRVGSFTKVLVGAGLLALRDAGKLSFDDPVVKYLPELDALVYPTHDSALITLRHLVTHSSGMTRDGRLEVNSDREVTEAELLKAAASEVLWYTPGTNTSYSNIAMALAGPVITRVTGKPFTEWLTQHLFQPLGMKTAAWDPRQVPEKLLAEGHVSDGKNGWKAPPPPLKLGAASAMGGLYASVEDLARFVSFELTAWPPRDAPDVGPLRRASVRESELAFGPTGGDSIFGVNWVILKDKDVGYVLFHNGSTGEYSASVWMVPNRQVAVIALAGSGNYGQLDTLAKSVLTVVAGASPEPPPKLAAPVEAALVRVLDLFVKADAATVSRAFTAKFLSTIPPDKLVEMIEKVSKAIGVCREHEAVKVQSATEAIVRVHCERGTIDLSITTEAKPPFLLDGLLVQPATP